MKIHSQDKNQRISSEDATGYRRYKRVKRKVLSWNELEKKKEPLISLVNLADQKERNLN
jgi:hypothetical protein